MNYSHRMRTLQRRSDLDSDIDSFGNFYRTTRHSFPQRHSIYIFHNDAVTPVFCLNDFVNRTNIRVRHGRDRASFHFKALQMSFVFGEGCR